jgi:hypothetical protein
MSTIISESSIFTVKKSDYTLEQWERIQKRNESEERAEAQLSQLYGERVATMILFNVMTTYKNTFKRFADTYEEACDGLGILVVNNIISRAVNGLPAQGVERREQENVKNL